DGTLVDVSAIYGLEEPRGLLGAPLRVGRVDQIEGVPRPRYLDVLHRFPRHVAQRGMERTCLADRDDRVVLAMDEQKRWRAVVDARNRRLRREHIGMTGLLAAHHDSLQEPLEVLTRRRGT